MCYTRHTSTLQERSSSSKPVLCSNSRGPAESITRPQPHASRSNNECLCVIQAPCATRPTQTTTPPFSMIKPYRRRETWLSKHVRTTFFNTKVRLVTGLASAYTKRRYSANLARRRKIALTSSEKTTVSPLVPIRALDIGEAPFQPLNWGRCMCFTPIHMLSSLSSVHAPRCCCWVSIYTRLAEVRSTRVLHSNALLFYFLFLLSWLKSPIVVIVGALATVLLLGLDLHGSC